MDKLCGEMVPLLYCEGLAIAVKITFIEAKHEQHLRERREATHLH